MWNIRPAKTPQIPAKKNGKGNEWPAPIRQHHDAIHSSEFLGRPNARLRCVRTESTVRPADDTDVAMRARGLSQGYRRAAAGARLLAG